MTESAPGKLSRQELYDRIRESSKDEYTLEEMKRLGFWPKDEVMPHASEELIKRKAELSKKLKELVAEHRKISDPEAALKQMRKQRMLESRQKREQTKLKNMQARYDKALAWHQRRQQEILFLGEGVSAALSHTENNEDKLKHFGLPVFTTAEQLANAMGVSLTELRFLSYNRAVSRVHHYRQFTITKKTGGNRRISAPMPRLKRVQYWILDNLLNKIPVHDAAHGFVAGRSIVSNAQVHSKAAMVINLDLQDFFPSISFKRVKGYFQSIGYNGQIATLLALLASEHDVDEVELDNVLYYLAAGDRKLPQGAPTSPSLSNLICYRLDKRLTGAVNKLGFSYTRYADDLTFSAKFCDDALFKKLWWRIHKIIADEGFVIHPDKTRILRKGARHEVTGIVVNDGLGLERKTLRRFQACLHQAKLDGIDNKQWGSGSNFINAITGFANYVHMVNPTKGKKFLAEVDEIKKRHGLNNSTMLEKILSKKRFRQLSSAGQAPADNWWQAVTRPVPLPEKPLALALEKLDKKEENALKTTRTEASASVDKTRAYNFKAIFTQLKLSNLKKLPAKQKILLLVAVIVFLIMLSSIFPGLTRTLVIILLAIFVWHMMD